jgi:O-antigen/teichoic acid export membrane protein
MLINAGSLVGTTAVTSILGFIYWWEAARRFPPEAVGIASASVSAMTLLGGLCILGLGTLLITELPRHPDQAGSLISTSLIMVGGVGGVVGFVFAVVAPYTSAGFKPLTASVVNIAIFTSGVSLTAISQVTDQALIGLLRGGLQFGRNTLVAVTKLVVLFVVSRLLSSGGGTIIYATWVIGIMLSLIALAALLVFKKGLPKRDYLPQWGLLRKLGFAALQHHLLNLTLQTPTLLLPLLVTALLSATMNAWFYIAWMIASFVFLVPNVRTIVLHAMNSAQQSTLAQKARVTISLGLVTSLAANCLLQLATKQVLSLFGSSYAEQATPTLRILLLAAFPLIIKYHYISICRIQDRIVRALLGMLPGGLLELAAAVLGAHLGGLTGLSAGWVAAIYVESIFMFRTVYTTVLSSDKSAPSIGMPYMEAEALWLMDTTPLPIIDQSFMVAEAPWLINKSLLPIVRFPAIGQDNREPNRNKQSLQDSASRRNNRSQQHLKPTRLQPLTPYLGDIPITDSNLDSLSLERRPNNSTIFID